MESCESFVFDDIFGRTEVHSNIQIFAGSRKGILECAVGMGGLWSDRWEMRGHGSCNPPPGFNLTGGFEMSVKATVNIYRIREIKDFLVVPKSKLDKCINDLKKCIQLHKKIGQGRELVYFEWIDDRENSTYIKLLEGKSK